MADKLDTEEWTQGEMISTFANTPHERHSIMVGFARGLSEGCSYSCPPTYVNEEHYYGLGWTVGEIADRLSSKTSPEDTTFGIGQLLGILTKYAIIALGSITVYSLV